MEAEFMFGKKKLFGNDVEPDCALCAHAEGRHCSLGIAQKPCARFRYDPLKRTPETLPPLKHFGKDDFKL